MLQHFMNFSYSEVIALTDDELILENAKMKWLLSEKAKHVKTN